ncbi:MAG: ribosomal protein S18-alanine N-acetyltransferase [Synergistetes bacterium]|nr:MAG: (SSU ribosomal protein S18P)-alanine acetyltransferase [bacterium 42_11]MBC7331641.1 ribosomal protein S18-alanine N-acetyltransferase [Synergistota bacterium]MDK2870784.1 [ribosomal protein S18]-alanine N-acetyltransferase [bacterium]
MILVDIDFMNVGDLDEVLEIERESFNLPWSRNLFLRELDFPGNAYIVARLRDRVVGYAGIRFYGRQAHITTIAVAPKWRGNRIGEQLLLALIEIAKDRQAKEIVLEVRPSNRIAIGLYEKYGFRTIGVIPGYYMDNGEDAFLMRVKI